ncbi:MAG: SDR family NAD(P)-dependent oxidoreductase [Myxococcales bacterium]|nr:SDR family NAD(P)-dependent oxidoreductase [Myxococcales bacterium]MCB9733559.1 SDR family NAD(P)-dependent oxidoreductase [Deltaproteobacteria bacterium]
MHAPPRGRRAILVTDAQKPIGRATALHLADRGNCVLAAAPTLDGLEDLPRETAAGGVIDVAAADLATADGCERALDRVQALFGQLDALIVGATTASFGPLEDVDDAHLREVFERNVFAPVTLLRAATPRLRARGRGVVICVGSVVGRLALPLSSLLSASHYALEGVCDALRLELRPFGIHVVLVEPGIVRPGPGASPLERLEHGFDALARESPYRPLAAALIDAFREIARDAPTPDVVAEIVHRALTAKVPRPRYTVSRRTAAWLFARKVLPDRVVDGRLSKVMGLRGLAAGASEDGAD